MKMMYGSTAVKSMKVHNFDVDSNDATMIASDLQSGVTAYAKGKKITGTGKSFEFAEYGTLYTNFPIATSSMINVIELSSLTYPIVATIALRNMKDVDFSTSQVISNISIDNTDYPITMSTDGESLTLSCEKTISLEVFFGKDNYI